MRSPTYFLIKPLDGKIYNNETKSGITTTTSVEDHQFTQRVAEVVKVPINYKGVIKDGDKVIVQHNTFRIQYTNQGEPIPSKYHIKDDLFYLEEQLIYMIIRGEDKIAVFPFCFVKPIIKDVKFEGVKEVENKGVLEYPNHHLLEQGFNKGDTVFLKKDSEYEFNLFDEKLYMMKSNRILCKE